MFGENSRKEYLCKKNRVMFKKIQKFWWFHFRNPVVRQGEAGGFCWVFRRFWLEISTKSGNFTARFTADEHPFGYLVAGKDDSNVHGFAYVLYTVGKLLTTDQGFVNDIHRAIQKYNQRLNKKAASGVVEDETEEKIALETEKQIQEIVDMPKKERRKYERGVDGRFKAAVKEAAKNEA